MVITARQARLAARMAEESLDDEVAIDHEDKRGIWPSVDMAVKVAEGVYGRRPNGWKIFVVEPDGRSTLRT